MTTICDSLLERLGPKKKPLRLEWGLPHLQQPSLLVVGQNVVECSIISRDMGHEFVIF